MPRAAAGAFVELQIVILYLPFLPFDESTLSVPKLSQLVCALQNQRCANSASGRALVPHQLLSRLRPASGAAGFGHSLGGVIAVHLPVGMGTLLGVSGANSHDPGNRIRRLRSWPCGR
jgi:hypothetical protein